MSSNARAGRLVRVATLLRVALRGLRGETRLLLVLTLSIGFGVASLVAIDSIARGFLGGLDARGRDLLGGDLSFTAVNAPLAKPIVAWLETQGRVSTVADLRAMARTQSDAALISLEAVGPDWPPEGRAVTQPPGPVSSRLSEDAGVFGLVADRGLGARLGVSLGSRLQIGAAEFQIRAWLDSDPEALTEGFALGPRVLVSQPALQAARLIQPGSLVQWIYRLRLPRQGGQPPSPAALGAFQARASASFPTAGWQIRTSADATPQLKQTIAEVTSYLNLVALTALVLGGLGSAVSTSVFITRKLPELASLKAAGAGGAVLFTLSLLQISCLALVGAAAGAALGSTAPFILAWFYVGQRSIPFTPSFYEKPLLGGLAFGLLVALTFAIPAAARAHDAPVAALFRAALEPGAQRIRARYLFATALCASALAGAAMISVGHLETALAYCGTTATVAVLFRGLGALAAKLARRRFSNAPLVLRLALTSLGRPGGKGPLILTALGLGLTFLIAATSTASNLHAQLQGPGGRPHPDLFFLDVPGDQARAFDALLAKDAPLARVEQTPMLRGRVTAINGVPVTKVSPKESAAWVLRGDRGLTYLASPPSDSPVKAGSWWPADYHGPPLLSMDSGIAGDLGLKIGDSVTVNVLGRTITARIANLRRVDWRSFGINFIFVYTPNTFAGAPHTILATASFPPTAASGADLSLIKDAARAFPNIAVIRVSDIFDQLDRLFSEADLAVGCLSAIVAIACALVLAGALASDQQQRLRETVLLKTLGATGGALLLALVVEYALWGVGAALVSIPLGESIARVVVLHGLQETTFALSWSGVLIAAAAAPTVAVLLGLAFTADALRRRPAAHLREA